MLRHNYMVVNMIFASNTVNYIPRIAHRCADVNCGQYVTGADDPMKKKGRIQLCISFCNDIYFRLECD